MRVMGWTKSVCFIFLFCLLICCGQKTEEAEPRLFSLEKVLTIDTENNETAEKGLTDFFHFDIDSEEYIYTGNTEEYEIRVFDFNGNLVRRIKREYEAVPVSDEDREVYEQRLEKFPPEMKESFFFPDVFPPFKDIVAYGNKWLFIQTYEQPNEGSFVYDIFNADGEFRGRTALEGYQVKFKGEKVYCLKEKESGYKELVVYRMIWD